MTGNVIPLLDKIIEYFPSPKADPGHTFKMLVSSIDYNPHLGRIAIGKITQGSLKMGQSIILTDKPGKPFTVNRILLAEGLGKVEAELAQTGDIVGIPGMTEVQIGLTMLLSDAGLPHPRDYRASPAYDDRG
jgi:GTP-binding protein